MAGDAQAKARKAVRRAQADFKEAQDKLEAVRESRRKSFEEAQAAGLSMREIAEETGLHFTRVAQIPHPVQPKTPDKTKESSHAKQRPCHRYTHAVGNSFDTVWDAVD